MLPIHHDNSRVIVIVHHPSNAAGRRVENLITAPSADGPPLGSRLGHGAVALTAHLDIFRVHAWRAARRDAALVGLLAAIKVDVLEVERVDVPGQVTQDGQADVDKQVCGRSGRLPVLSHIQKTHPWRILPLPTLPAEGLRSMSATAPVMSTPQQQAYRRL